MNNKERKEQRYIRRKKKREEKILDISNKYANINNAFTFSKGMYYTNKCMNEVRWKRSTKLFNLHLFTNIATVCYEIKNDCYVVSRTYKFKINERGKVRDIDAPCIRDRLVHKIITNEILIPIYDRHLIYDNGASMKGKGFMFALDRVKHKTIKQGLDGYVLLIDYSKYFESCSHLVIHDIHNKYIKNLYTIKVIEDYLFIGKGIALGIEIAQKEACMLPNYLDHYVENKYPIVRYMDDSIIFTDSYESSVKLLDEYTNKAGKLGIIINPHKSKILPIKDGFKYCKWLYILNGKLIIIPFKKTIIRQRRKLRKLIKLYNNKKITKEEIDNIYNSFKAYISIYNGYKYIINLNNIYKQINETNRKINI